LSKCADDSTDWVMWQPYLDVIREKCSQALHILDRFHIVSKMNKALDEVRAAESRRTAQDGHDWNLKRLFGSHSRSSSPLRA
jgi:transposase